MKSSVSKLLIKISVVILLCLLLVMSVTACRQNIPNSDNISKNFFETMDSMEITTILDYYSKIENSVFLKLEIVKIYDEVYIDKKDIAIPGASGIVLIECHVIEDLFESGFEQNAKVVVPIFLNQCFIENDSPIYKDIDITDIKTWLSVQDHIYIKTQSRTSETFVVKSNHTIELQTNLFPCNISLYEILPSKEEKICIDQVSNFLSEKSIDYLPCSEIYGMDTFCPNNILCTTFESNVKELSKYFDSKLTK
mgnify:CR=1 FL=1